MGQLNSKRPSIREHSFYLHFKNEFKRIPYTNLWCLNMIHLDLDNLFYFWIFLSFSFSSLLYHVHISFSFSFCIHKQCCLDQKLLITPLFLTIDLCLPFLPNLNKNVPYLNVPLIYGKRDN